MEMLSAGLDRYLSTIDSQSDSQSPSSPKSRVYPSGGLLLHRRQDMRVGVESEGYLAVSQYLHHDSGVDSLRKHECRTSVSKVVKPLMPQTSQLQKRVKPSDHRGVVEWCPLAGSED